LASCSGIGDRYEPRKTIAALSRCPLLAPVAERCFGSSVADGAGSAALAEVGAKIAVEAVVETICQQQERLPQNDANGRYS
jgi:hypothetical protein